MICNPKSAIAIQDLQETIAQSQVAPMTVTASVTAIIQYAIAKTVIPDRAANFFRVPTAALIKAFALRASATANRVSEELTAHKRLVLITALRTDYVQNIQSVFASLVSKALTAV